VDRHQRRSFHQVETQSSNTDDWYLVVNVQKEKPGCHKQDIEALESTELGPKEKEHRKKTDLGPQEKITKKKKKRSPKKIPKSNNSGTKKYLHTIHKYLDCREKMDAKYLEVDELQTIAKFQLTTDSGGIETESDDPHEFKTEYQQQSIKAGPVKSRD
jgi:hypothetical protein